MTARALYHTLLPLAFTMTTPLAAAAQLRLARIYGDGMVMQRDAAVPVRGWADPGDRISVTFRDRTFAAVPDAAGRWQVLLPAQHAGGPYTLHVAGRNSALDVRDILVGDVWLCSGQSNMEFELANARHGAEDAAATHDPGLREFKVPRSWANEAAADLSGGAWALADPAHAPSFTAVGYYFARALRAHRDVPIGLINTSWGGSRIEAWMSAPSQQINRDSLNAILEQGRARDLALQHALEQKIGGLPKQDGGLVDGQAFWADPALDDAQWASLSVPSLWEQQGYEGLDGIAWYRNSFDLTEAEAAAGVQLALGMIDDNDITYLNGQEIGRTVGYNVPRVYRVPASALRAGRNVLAIRVEDTGGGGGLYGEPAQVYLETAAGKRSLAGTWKFKVGAVVVGTDYSRNQVPTLLYNAMLHPLLDFPVAGVLWYQGESNADRPADAIAYRTQFAAMIRDWRDGWQRPGLPFLWVQLPNYMAASEDPAPASNWALLRESQTAALSLPRTGQAVIIDLGKAADIHPRNKKDVGERLALVARRVAYRERLLDSGPTFRAFHVRAGRATIDFANVGRGLKAGGREGQVKGFAIAGADRRWVWANARIEGTRVVVWNDQVPNPVALRYAWADNPDQANLYNEDGLPAAPFRTDAW